MTPDSPDSNNELLGWVDRLLPAEALAGDITDRMRQRLLVAFGLLVSTVTLPWYALMIQRDPVIRLPRVIALLTVAMLAANPLWLRITSVRRASGLTILLLHLAMLANCALNGGLNGPVAFGIACLPVITGVLWGHRAGWIDMGFVITAAATIDYIDRAYGLPMTAPAEIWPLVRVMALAISLGLMMLAFSAYSELSRRQARELSLARDVALQASRAKSNFLSSMSHELRTPMVGVVGAAELLMKGEHTAAQGDLLRSLQRSATAQLELIGDVLDISRIESDRLQLDRTSVAPRQVLDEINSVFQLACQAKGISLDLDIPDDLPQWIETDELRLRQILSNLVNNALKFTHEGSIAVRVTATGEKQNTRLRFEVHDTGIGFETAQAEELFGAFRQADGSTTRKFGGSGLGLSICRHLVEALGGTIHASGSPGEGATFTFELPTPEQDGPDPGTAPLVVSSRDKLHVLLADDEPINRFILSSMLHELGHSVTEAENGRQAIELAQSEPIDLIILDMHMPELDGPACARELRALPSAESQLPILGLTADAIIENRPLYLQSGIDVLYSKPIELERLGMAISQATALALERTA